MNQHLHLPRGDHQASLNSTWRKFTAAETEAFATALEFADDLGPDVDARRVAEDYRIRLRDGVWQTCRADEIPAIREADRRQDVLNARLASSQ